VGEEAAIAGAQADPPVAEVAARGSFSTANCLGRNQAMRAEPVVSEVIGDSLRSRSAS
jgi:hypothetical protein